MNVARIVQIKTRCVKAKPLEFNKSWIEAIHYNVVISHRWDLNP